MRQNEQGALGYPAGENNARTDLAPYVGTFSGEQR